MITVDFNEIANLGITPGQCVEWVQESFLKKPENQLPPKVSMHWGNNIFFNTMPCHVVTENRICVKTVSRYPDESPTMKSELMLWDANNGASLALMDATWITTMRTGAVAALSAELLITNKNANRMTNSGGGVSVAFIGLGNTARATLLCMRAAFPGHLNVCLLKYKKQAEDFVERFRDMKDVTFHILDDRQELLQSAQVVVSCVTSMDEQFASDEDFPAGITVIPVHTRGFQNCDLFFDKVFADDTGHVCNFKYFPQFKKFAEMSDVLLGKAQGRESADERILAYNIGIGLHDGLFASKIYDIVIDRNRRTIDLKYPIEKFWV